jgi:hypothetical protein
MNAHRVTLRAFGTTGVLVAASLAMLATVSALVAFDGWPNGYGSSSVDSVSVTGTAQPSALVVRPATAQRGALTATATAPRGTPAPAGFVKTAGPAPAAAGFATGFVKTIGPVGPGSGGSGSFGGPLPQVPIGPPGECGAACQTPPSTQPGTIIPEPVQHTACSAASSVCGVTQRALTSELPAPVGTPPAGLPRGTMPSIHVQVQVPVQVPAQVPQVPGP